MSGTQLRGVSAVSHRSGLYMDPRFQARLLEVRRDQGRRRLRTMGRAVIAALVVAGLWGLTRSPLLAVRRIAVNGGGHTGRATAVSVTGLDGHHQMLDLSPDGMRERLRALPWVADASVGRQWPGTVKLAITERVPVAQVPGPGAQPAIADAGGRILAVGREASAVLAAQRPSLPVIEGMPPAPVAGQALGARAGPALVLASAVRSALSDAARSGASGGRGALTMTSVAIGPDGTLTVSVSQGVLMIFGSAEQLDTKLLAMRTVLAHLVTSGPVTVDLRVAGSPVLTEGSSRSIVSTIQRG